MLTSPTMGDDSGASPQPRLVGRYLVCKQIAAGGMATVHLGRVLGASGFSRIVAIKRLHAQFASDADFSSMFVDEARMAARIRHNNVAATLDVVASDDELFLVMEYVHGEAFSRLLASTAGTPPSVAVVSAIMVGTLHGLHAAHEATNERGEALGIVHRDISPHNILVGVDGVARVIDFGVAKAEGRAHNTRDGEIKGKIPYMSVEQLVNRPVDRRTDVYAASVVLWEALAGRRLFKGESSAATFGKVLGDVIEPPSRYRELPKGLDSLVLRGLDRDPGRRFDTAEEMAAVLQACAPPAAPTEVSRWLRANAGPALESRSREIEGVEAIDAGAYAADRPANAPHSSRSMDAVSDAAPRSISAVTSESETMGRLSSAAIPVYLAPPPSRRRTLAVAVAGAIAIIGAVTVVGIRRGVTRHSEPGASSVMVGTSPSPDKPTAASPVVTNDAGWMPVAVSTSSGGPSAAASSPTASSPTRAVPWSASAGRGAQRGGEAAPAAPPQAPPAASGGFDTLFNTRK